MPVFLLMHTRNKEPFKLNIQNPMCIATGVLNERYIELNVINVFVFEYMRVNSASLDWVIIFRAGIPLAIA